MQAYAGFAGAVAVIVAAFAGRASFESWLKQKKVERKLAVGERILTFAYKAKDAISAIRNPAQFGFEVKKAEEACAKSDAEAPIADPGRRKEKLSYVIFQRIKTYETLWDELYECLSLARIFFGAELEAAVKVFAEQRNAVQVAVMMYPTTPNSNALHSKFERDFWEGLGNVPGEPGDQVADAVSAAVSRIEGAILPLIAD